MASSLTPRSTARSSSLTVTGRQCGSIRSLRVSDGVEDQYISSWVNGIPGIMLQVQRQPGTNTVEIVDNIRKLIPRFFSMMPPSVNLSVEYDRSVPIRKSVEDVQFTLLLAIFLVILVIFLFLRNISATIMPSLALPMSIMGTFAVMYLFGYTIDTLIVAGADPVGRLRGR